MDKGEQKTHAASTAPPVLVAQLQEATGLSEAAVRSVLWQTRQLGWRVVQTEDTRSTAHRRGDDSWSVHGDSAIHMNGPCERVVVVTEEWTP